MNFKILLLTLLLFAPAWSDETKKIIEATGEQLTPTMETVLMESRPWAMVAFFDREAGWTSVLRYFPGQGWATIGGARGGPGNEQLVLWGIPKASILKMIPQRPDMHRPTPAELEAISLGPYWSWLSERAVREDELTSNWWELTLMRNEVYARHGRRFQDPALADYFRQRPWYQPNANYSDRLLSDLERQNVETIAAYQKRGNLQGPARYVP